jgi:ubiquinone/menaquinone biosynthesis C-methylase UbiE
MNWNDKAKEYDGSEIGAHSDETLVELENEFILRQLKRIKPGTLLDIGCGNGRRTKKWAKHVRLLVLGIDSSDEMIKLAHEMESNKLAFDQEDIRELETNAKFDVVISARCLINLASEREQMNAIDKIYNLLNPSGYFICVEGVEEATTRLDKMREFLGIEKLKRSELNIDLSDNVLDYIYEKFDKEWTGVNDHRSLGTYYFITRVLTQIKGMNLKEAAKRLQLEYGDELGICSLGRHFCFCGRRGE